MTNDRSAETLRARINEALAALRRLADAAGADMNAAECCSTADEPCCTPRSEGTCCEPCCATGTERTCC